MVRPSINATDHSASVTDTLRTLMSGASIRAEEAMPCPQEPRLLRAHRA